MRLRIRSLLLPLVAGASAVFAGSAQAQVGDPFCLGTSCPCGNNDPDAGCGNAGLDGDPATGARLLAASGSTNVTADDLVLAVEGIAPGRFGVLVAGTATSSTPLGDGQLCVASNGQGIARVAPKTAGLSGRFSQTRFVANLANSTLGPITPGTTIYFQAYYRDSSGPCGFGFNLSNALPVTFGGGAVELELAGEALDKAPHFDSVDAFNSGAAISATLDPLRFPSIAGVQANAYVVEARTRSEWDQDASLVDVRGAATAVDFAGGDLASNIFTLDTGTLAGPTGTDLYHSYDLVFDMDGDGQLGDGDFIDGRGDEDGFGVFRDLTMDGPHAVTELIHDHGGSFHKQNIFYPSDIANLGELPLIVISHGNGHLYTWYDHIGLHMASYGYVVMSHQNNTNPGPAAASTTTLQNTDLFLQNLAQIDGGAMVGHVDSNRIVWVGHSRGAEGIARAYQRLFTGLFTPVAYDKDDIQLLSSIAPTDFLGPNSNPQDVPFQLWTGAGDADVTGAPNNSAIQTYHLLTRARGLNLGVTYHGVGHGAFHNGNGSLVVAGSCVVGRGATHRLMNGYFLPTVTHVLEGDPIAEEFLWRKWQSIKPIDAPHGDCADIVYEYSNAPSAADYIVDDFQSENDLGISSSGGAVLSSVTDLVEDRMQDGDGTLSPGQGDAMNGMTRNAPGDDERGIVFEWTSPAHLEFEVQPEARNFTQFAFLSFRGCQSTRHGLTIVDKEDLSFFATLRDGQGHTASLPTDAYDGGITDPFDRFGVGAGLGWVNEFETTRMRLADFRAQNTDFDLTDVVAIRFEFGEDGVSAVGRIGLDDIELVQE